MTREEVKEALKDVGVPVQVRDTDFRAWEDAMAYYTSTCGEHIYAKRDGDAVGYIWYQWRPRQSPAEAFLEKWKGKKIRQPSWPNYWWCIPVGTIDDDFFPVRCTMNRGGDDHVEYWAPSSDFELYQEPTNHMQTQTKLREGREL